jgi:hypothetical protein
VVTTGAGFENPAPAFLPQIERSYFLSIYITNSFHGENQARLDLLVSHLAHPDFHGFIHRGFPLLWLSCTYFFRKSKNFLKITHFYLDFIQF